MKKVSLLFVFLLSCIFAFSQSIFLYAGKSVPTDEPQGQPVVSYSLGTPDAGGNIHEMTVVIVMGQMSQELFEAVAQGTPFDKMELRFYDNGKKLNKFTMVDVLVTSAQVSGTNQLVTLEFNKIKL
jgi:type VI protein secretion system component Hcp